MGQGRFSNLELESGAAEKAHEDGQFVATERDAAYYLAQAERRLLAGDHESALRAFSAALGEDPVQLEPWVGQLKMLLALGELPEAQMWADKALERFPDNPRLLAAKAVAMCRMGLRRDARALCDAALKKAGEDSLVWLCRGEIILAESESAARRCFDRVLGFEPENVENLLAVGSLYLEHELYTAAIDVLRQACDKEPRAARAWYLLGCCQRDMRLADQARASFARAVSHEPQMTVYRNAAATINASTGGWLGSLWKRVTGK